MSIFLLKGKDPEDVGNPVKTYIVITETEIQARKFLPPRFEVYEIEIRPGGFGELSGIVGWLGDIPAPISVIGGIADVNDDG